MALTPRKVKDNGQSDKPEQVVDNPTLSDEAMSALLEAKTSVTVEKETPVEPFVADLPEVEPEVSTSIAEQTVDVDIEEVFEETPAIVTQPEPAQTQETPAQPNNNSELKGKNTMSLTMPFRAPVSSNTSEKLVKFVEQAKKWVEGAQPQLPFEVSVDLIEDNRLYCPVVAVTAKASGGRTRTFSLLIEHARREEKVFTEDDGTQIVMTTSEAYTGDDGFLKNLVSERLANLGLTQTTHLGHSVVHKIEALDAEHIADVHVASAVLCLANKLEGIGRFSLKEIQSQGKVLRNCVNIQPGTTDTDFLGLPVATDIVSEISAVSKTERGEKKERKMHSTDGDSTILRANAIFDFIPTDGMDRNVDGVIARTFGTLGIFVTNVEGLGAADVYEDTSSYILAAVGMAPFLEEGKENHLALVGRTVKNGSKARIGTLGMYHNPAGGQPLGFIDTADSHDQADKKKLSPVQVARNFLDEGAPMVGIDIMQGSRLSWAAKPFADYMTADAGSAEYEKARKAILRAVSALGDGDFEFQGEIIKPLAIQPYGVFENGSQETRSYDNLAKMFMCEGNLDNVVPVLANGTKDNMDDKGIHTQLQWLNTACNPDLLAYYIRGVFTYEFYAAVVNFVNNSKVGINHEGITAVRDNRLSGGVSFGNYSQGVKSLQGTGFNTNTNKSGGSMGFSF